MTTPAPSRRMAAAGWGVLALLACAHWLLFAGYVRRELAWAYAPNYDQTTFLQLAYLTYDGMGRDGPWRALAHAARTAPPTGALLHLEAAALFVLAGASRLSALSVNWLHFAVLQVAVIATLRARAPGWALPALALGLLWSLRTTFFWAGGLDDFRLDFAASCLYGTFLTLVLRSDGFRHAGWSLAAGAAATVCVLTRSLTSVYLAALLLPWMAVLALRLARAPRGPVRAERRRALVGAASCSACLVLVALPTLALRARSLWNYYVVGHLTGPESAVRAAESGVRSLWQALAYYPSSLLVSHAGLSFAWLACGALALMAVARRPRGEAASAFPAFRTEAVGFVAASVAAPLLVLSADSAKSPVVAGLLAPPLVWAVLLAAARLAPRARPAAVWAAGGVVLAAGAAFQVGRLTGPAPASTPVEARREVSRLHDDVLRVVREQGLAQPSVLADRKRDFVPALHVAAYERHGFLLAARYPLAGVVWSPEPRDVADALAGADFVILTSPAPLPPHALPYDQRLAEMEPALRDHCTRRLEEVGTYHVPEEVRLYARRPAGVGSGGKSTGPCRAAPRPFDALTEEDDMRFMMLVIPKGYETAAAGTVPDADAVARMMRYNESLQKAGVLLALDGLHPPSMGARVTFEGGKPRVHDGPFAEAKEVLGGYWMIQVRSKEEAIEWATRCPMADNEIIEVRQVQEMSDFPEDVQKAAAGFTDMQQAGATTKGRS